jgi:hypothetical protein
MCRSCGRLCEAVSTRIPLRVLETDSRVDAHVLCERVSVASTCEVGLINTYSLEVNTFLQVRHDPSDAMLQVGPSRAR